MTEPNEIAFDDGLPCPEVGRWAELKYRLFALYASLFSKGMKYKWDERVYVDLYAGAGFSRVRGTTNVIAGSPVLALSVDDSFDKYIFCEQDSQLLSALRERTKRIAPTANVAFISGDCNSRVGDILAEIPPASAEHTVLGLCFVDPFGIGIKFDTLRRLSTRYLDFLCLLAVYMDANRNYARYLSEDSRKVDEFLGSADWRQRWTLVQAIGAYFPKFLAEEFATSMKSLGYIPPPLYTMKEVRSDEKNLRLYYLALFSRNQKAYEYWNEVLKYGTDQRSFEY